MTTTLEWKETKIVEGSIEVVTGLHIGSGNDTVEIGGMDNPVIKNPANSEPYIPGSSLKGKMRSLMEWKLNKVDPAGKVHVCNILDCEICRIFGSTKDNNERGPTRLIVRDANLSDESRNKFKNEGRALLETKYENTINRILGKAANPRPMERVVPGTKFDFQILYKVLDDADEDNFKVVIQALAALENDYLGGCGSRGSGQIKISIDYDGGNISPAQYLEKL